MSDFDTERKWSSWFHRTGKKVQGMGESAKSRAAHARNSEAARAARNSEQSIKGKARKGSWKKGSSGKKA